VVASSGGFAGTSEEVVIEPGSASIGTGDFFVRTVYFAATHAINTTASSPWCRLRAAFLLRRRRCGSALPELHGASSGPLTLGRLRPSHRLV
jgi:hypothetical protein